MIKTYSELLTIDKFNDRIKYLQTSSKIGESVFGGHRYLNQIFYKSPEWRRLRRQIILRDDGCDLAHKDYPIYGKIYIHHLNPLRIDDILEHRFCVIDLENLVCVSFNTHNMIHYATELPKDICERKPNDTCPWK